MKNWMWALVVVASLGAGVVLAHPAVGPHKGPLAEWGEEEYHVEVVADAKTGAVTAYVYDGEVEKAKPIDAKTLTLTLKTKKPVTLKLEAKPAEADPKGKASVFVGKTEPLPADWKLEGSVSGKVGDKPFSGEFKQK